MSTQQIKIVGFKEILKKIESMPKKMAEKLERKALRKSLKELASLVEAKAPVDDGELKASIKVQVKKKRGEVVGSVLADSPHAHLVEYGHKLVKGGKLGKGGKVIGFVEPSPTPRGFMRASLDEYGEQLVHNTVKAVEEELKSMEDKS